LGTVQDKISKKTEINAAWVLNRLAAEVMADIADLYDDENNLKPVAEWPVEFRQGLIAGIDSDGGIKLSDRLKRLELIGKHIGVQAFNEKSTVDVGLSDLSDDELKARLAVLEGKTIDHQP